MFKHINAIREVMKKLKPIHPGEVLFEEFLLPLSISQNKLALAIVFRHAESMKLF